MCNPLFVASLSGVLDYMADVAGRESVEAHGHVGTVIWTGRAGWGAYSEILPDRGRARAFADLVRIDALHREERLLRQGVIWVLGEHKNKRYFFPLIERELKMSNLFATGVDFVMGGGRGFPEQSSPFRVNTKMPRVTNDDLPVLSNSAVWRLSEQKFDLSKMVRKDDPEVIDFIRSCLRIAGLPLTTPIYQSRGRPSSRRLRVVVGAGLYLDRDPFQLDRESALRMWRSVSVNGTVVDHLYGPAADRVSAEAKARVSGVVRSPLPLNQAQHRAVQSTRTRPITVVSGPPGSGKSHLVAAAAINAVAAGRSVLVATQSTHACDVIEDLLDQLPGVDAQRFGHGESMTELSNRLAAGVPEPDDQYDEQRLRAESKELVAQLSEHRSRLARRLEEVDGFDDALRRRHDLPLSLAIDDVERLDADQLRVAASQLGSRLRARSARRRLRELLGPQVVLDPTAVERIAAAVEAHQRVSSLAGRTLPFEEMWSQLDDLEARQRANTAMLLEAQRRARAGSKNRAALSALASALRSDEPKRRQWFTEMGDRFLEVVPFWLGTLGEIEATLPVVPGLFDLVILDEASQISQLSAVPAFARAKRAMVVGDSRQLRHVSYVSAELQTQAAAARRLDPETTALLDDRTNSAFDVATARASVIDLDEHFRSAPHIIGFSSARFYDGGLRLMTQHPRSESRDAIDVRRVSGERNEAGVVEAEVAEVLSVVRDLIERADESIGIVTPSDAQAAAIETAVLDACTIEQIERHRIRIGTVFAFQGSERDHVIVSLGLAGDDQQARAAAEDPATFNVMVTRARHHVTLVTALDPSDRTPGLITDYIRHAAEPPEPQRERVQSSGWTDRVAGELSRALDARVITNYEVARETIDVVVGSDERAIGIETELHPNGAESHIERHLVLRRAGWELTAFFESSAHGREEEAIAELVAMLIRRGA